MPQPDYPWYRHYDSDVPKNLTYPQKTVLELFEDRAREAPDRPAVIFFGHRLSYGQLVGYVDRVAAGLKDLGLDPGERLALLLPNCPQYVIAFFAAVKAGLTVVPLNPLNTERELEFIVRDAGVKAAVVLDLLAARVQKVRERVSADGSSSLLSKVIYAAIPEFLPFPLNWLYPLRQPLSAEAKSALPYGLPFSRLLSARVRPLVPPPVDREKDLAVLIYTGGTTGKPKGVMLSHRALVVNASQVMAWGQIAPADRVLAVLPLFHGFGMSVGMNAPLITGAASVLVPRYNAGDLLRVIHRQRPTLFAGVPTMYIGMINHPDLKRYDLSSLRGCFAGAAALPAEIKRRWEELTGGRLLEGYGLTEAVTAKSANPYRGLNKTGSIGIPFPDTVMEIVDLETGEKVLKPGEIGEIRLKSPDLMLGYWKRPEETAAALRGGWLYTGDLGKMDEDGYFYIVERKKDLIITGGFNVYPREVEDVLYLHPAVREASVIGVPDEYRGEAVKAFVVLREGMTATEAEIIAFCREQLTPYKVPRQVEFVPDLPKSAIGKVLRRALREKVGSS
ncbi:MAG: long-chain fatty acid--CoA ligase [Firmicutes bacterium]|nr:long-chain fatty acid--CoA ligase [Bacillota bacterium]MCL5038775.1 long-chain fatty acid--CoA ligase [Bacillota bacterium]